MKKYVLAASSLLLSAMTSFGGGYQLNLQGLRQVAMGGSGTAWPWDASTIFYNPGGLSRLKSIQVYGSVMSIMPSTAFANQVNSGDKTITTRTVDQHFTPFNLYVGGPVQEYSRWGLGLGIYTPFGTGTKWDDNWIGKYIVQSIDLKCIFFQPTVSYMVNDWISVGAGFVYSTGSIDFRQAMPVHGSLGPGSVDEGQAILHSNADGLGFNLGAQFKMSDNLQFGLTYRSQVNMNVSAGSATFNVPASLRTSFPNTQFDSQLPLPQVASFGVGYRTGALTLQLDLNYTGWNSYDSLRFDFKQQTSSLHNVHAPRNYRNTLTTRVGACYKISKVVSVMAGAAYDPTPVTNGFVSPELPDADRMVLSCGISVKPLPRFTILAAFEGVTSATRDGVYEFGGFSGTYKTQAATPGIGLYYNF